MFNIVINSYK